MKSTYKKVISLLVCLACAASILCACDNPEPNPSSDPSTLQTSPTQTTAHTDPTWPPIVSTFEPYDWASLYTIVTDSEFSDLDGTSFDYNLNPGDVYMSEFLLQYLSVGTDASQVYSIYVLERTGASRDEVYQNLIQHLEIVCDEYMEHESINVTQDQLLAIEWPEEYGFLLGVAPDYSSIYPNLQDFTKEELENVEADYIPVCIWMEYPVVLSPQDQEFEQERIARAYGLQLDFSGKNPYFAYAFAAPEQLIALLNDPYLNEIRNMKSLSNLLNWDQ